MYCVSPEVAELVPQIVRGGQLITLVVWDVLKVTISRSFKGAYAQFLSTGLLFHFWTLFN